MKVASYDAENVVSLLTEIEDGVALAVQHIKALPNLTNCGIPVLFSDTLLVGWLPACNICFSKYYEVM